MSLDSLKNKLLIFIALVATPVLALAHAETSMLATGWEGFLHPLSGMDHLLAMVAVGLWAAHLRGSATIVLPVVFPLTMAAGALLAVSGWALPAIEPMIAMSVVVFGILVATGLRMPVAVGSAAIALFAVFHGHAHATEGSGDLLAYGAGFIVSTVLLHVAGVLIGAALIAHARSRVLAIGGSAIATTGLALLFI